MSKTAFWEVSTKLCDFQLQPDAIVFLEKIQKHSDNLENAQFEC